MSDPHDSIPDDERPVPLDEPDEVETPPATLDPEETVERDVDEWIDEERASAIEAGEIDPGV